MITENGYCSLADSGTDSAYGIFFDSDGLLIGVGIGPGYQPDGSNKPKWAWGGCWIWDGDQYPDMNEWMQNFLSGDYDIRETFAEKFDDWENKQAVIDLMRRVIEQ